jgi:hypothetical protein
MSNLITSTEVKTIVSPVKALDPAFYDKSIEYIQDSLLKPILTDDLYDAVVADPDDFTTLMPYIKNFLAYAIAFEAYQKDLERQINNQGIQENNTQFSKTSNDGAATRVLARYKEREFYYGEKLGHFLIDNADDYPDFDIEQIFYQPNLRRFFPI